MHWLYEPRFAFSVDTDLHTKPATNTSTAGMSQTSPVTTFKARPVCNSQMSGKIGGASGKLSCTQACVASSRSQLNACVKAQPLERPRCSRTLTTESVPLHAVPTRQIEPACLRSPQRCFVVRLSQ